jgi:dolichyl-phosphate-mannose-protein mannosyltransferase
MSTNVPSISAVPSSAAPPPVIAAPVVNEQPKNDAEVSEAAVVSPPPEGIPKELPVLSKEERIEYRDENGRVLNDEEVAELAGKVSFKTRYETRTRIVDAQGNEIYEGLVDAHGAEEAGVAPPHPDVEGQNPETQEGARAEASDLPPAVEVAEDQAKEQSVEQSLENEKNEPKPASEAQAATQE